MHVRGIGVAGVYTLVFGLLAHGQSPRPQFRAGVELVQIDVAVLDDKRQPVRGLKTEDFTVLEDGSPRPIRAFTPVELAPRLRTSDAVWANDVPPDVATNQSGEQEGRLVVILMDRSIPVEQPTLVARRVATAAVNALGTHDLAAVVSTGSGAVQNLTADRARLLRAIEAGDPSTGLSPEQEYVFGKQDPLRDGRCLCGLCVHETITRVAEAVRNAPRRRKVLLFIGSSIIWQANRPAAQAGADVGCETRLKDARNAMFAAVDRANLTVHSVDPQGLVNIGPQVRAGAPGGVDRPVNSGPQMRLGQQQIETNQTLTRQQSLQVLPERTGGRTIVGRNDPDADVPAIVGESEAYYVLGFERGPSKRADGVRSVDVKVGRRNVRVHAVRRYVLPPDQASADVVPPPPADAEDALTSLLPSAGRPLAIAVTPFASPDGTKTMARVNVDVRAFARADGTPVPLNLSFLAVDPTGRAVASVRQSSSIAAGRLAEGAAAPEVNVESFLDLPPGEYGVRVAVVDPATRAVASVFTDLTVPAFERAALSLSGVSVEAANAPAARPAPTTRRAFRRDEQVRAVLQIYQGTGRSEPLVPVSMRVQIVDAKGTAVRDQSLPFAVQAFANRRADCVITLPLASLPAGDYLLKLESSAERQRAGRALRFAVESR